MPDTYRKVLEEQFGKIDDDLFELAKASAEDHVKGNLAYTKDSKARSDLDSYNERLFAMKTVIEMMKRPMSE